tara:strand:- start:2427 stop:3461 length:1035 start_codon:yes stop_codon:yes gene_type:complete
MQEKELKKFFKNKIILISGGTGSFGNEFLKSLLKFDCTIRIFSRDELKQDEMRNRFSNPKIEFFIGDVRDESSIDKAIKGTDFIFHAAALKQVPSCEFFPLQAVATNVIGSSNIIRSAISHKVKKIVCLSTDKAVYPINAMGMSKAMMEKIAISESRNLTEKQTNISAVRYGNVMCSRGSVIPLFINQIKNKKPITITDPNMTRFLLPLPEAIELVLFAFKNSKQGDLFIRKSPACTVNTLAKALKNIFNSSIKNNYIGIRHGEKVYETLASSAELLKSKSIGNYLQIASDSRSLNYDKFFSKGQTSKKIQPDYTSHNTKRLNVKEVEILLKKLPYVRNALKSG